MEKVKRIGEYLGCNKEELWSEMSQLFLTLHQKHQEEIEKAVREERIRCYDVVVRLASKEAVSVDDCNNIVVLPKNLFLANLSVAFTPTKTDKQTEV